ncbi:MAG: dodecin family protein [Bellilinea sp.]|nr:dodecin family protein [Bellilinea sp.]
MMAQHTYKLIEITGTSPNSIEDAIQTAVSRAGQTIRHMQWLEVVEIRGRIEEDQVKQWQVTFKVGFTLEE